MFKSKQKNFLISMLLLVLFLATLGTAFSADLNETLEAQEVSVSKDNLENSQNETGCKDSLTSGRCSPDGAVGAIVVAFCLLYHLSIHLASTPWTSSGRMTTATATGSQSVSSGFVSKKVGKKIAASMATQNAQAMKNPFPRDRPLSPSKAVRQR